MGGLAQDLRYPARGLARSPGFAVVAILTLALGIGANTAIFSIVNVVLLSPLPYPDSDRLVRLYQNETKLGVARSSTSAHNFVDLRDRSRSFEEMSAYRYAAWIPSRRALRVDPIVALRCE